MTSRCASYALAVCAVVGMHYASSGCSGHVKTDSESCTPRAPLKPNLTYGTDALPRGSCEPGTGQCELTVQEDCPCPDDHGPVDGVRCMCENGQWHCAIAAQGTAICARPASCVEFDAAIPTDAGEQ